jgi:hypothetical protein
MSHVARGLETIARTSLSGIHLANARKTQVLSGCEHRDNSLIARGWEAVLPADCEDSRAGIRRGMPAPRHVANDQHVLTTLVHAGVDGSAVVAVAELHMDGSRNTVAKDRQNNNFKVSVCGRDNGVVPLGEPPVKTNGIAFEEAV